MDECAWTIKLSGQPCYSHSRPQQICVAVRCVGNIASDSARIVPEGLSRTNLQLDLNPGKAIAITVSPKGATKAKVVLDISRENLIASSSAFSFWFQESNFPFPLTWLPIFVRILNRASFNLLASLIIRRRISGSHNIKVPETSSGKASNIRKSSFFPSPHGENSMRRSSFDPAQTISKIILVFGWPLPPFRWITLDEKFPRLECFRTFFSADAVGISLGTPPAIQYSEPLAMPPLFGIYFLSKIQ